MLKHINSKQFYYLLFDQSKTTIDVGLSTRYTIHHLLIKKNYKLNIGNTMFVQKTNNIMNLNRPFWFLAIPRKPKSYPFKKIKS